MVCPEERSDEGVYFSRAFGSGGDHVYTALGRDNFLQ